MGVVAVVRLAGAQAEQADVRIDALRVGTAPAARWAVRPPCGPAMADVECRADGAMRWGAGLDTSVLTAAIPAVLSAVNRKV